MVGARQCPSPPGTSDSRSWAQPRSGGADAPGMPSQLLTWSPINPTPSSPPGARTVEKLTPGTSPEASRHKATSSCTSPPLWHVFGTTSCTHASTSASIATIIASTVTSSLIAPLTTEFGSTSPLCGNWLSTGTRAGSIAAIGVATPPPLRLTSRRSGSRVRSGRAQQPSRRCETGSDRDHFSRFGTAVGSMGQCRLWIDAIS